MLGSLILLRQFLKINQTPSHAREPSLEPSLPERGAYLLEYAAVFLGLAFFIIGLSDIARIYHARGAVRAGVTEGLRCLYPTDAGCNETTPGSGSLPLERFNAYVTRVTAGSFYELPRVSYSIGAGWFNQPVLEAAFLTKALSAVTLSEPLDPYRRYDLLFPAVANAAYLLKVRDLPLVAAGPSTNVRDQALDPVFRDRESGEELKANLVKDAPNFSFNLRQLREGEYTEVKTLSFVINHADIVDQGSVAGSISFAELKRLEGAYSFIALCYQGPRIDRGAGAYSIQWPASASPASCSHRAEPQALYSGDAFKVPIVIHIAGRGSISGSSSQWQGVDVGVEVQLAQEGTLVDLGGRKFTRTTNSGPSQSGNFVVRGAGEVDRKRFDAERSYLDACERSGYTECSTARYVHLPLIKVGVPFELRFRMRWKRGAAATNTPSADVGWTGGAVRVFTPQFQAVHEERGCGFSKTPNLCTAEVSPMHSSYTTTNLNQSFSFEDANDLRCELEAPSGDFYTSIPQALEVYRSSMISGALALKPLSFWSPGSATDSCQPRVREISCNDNSPHEYMRGCEPDFNLPGDALKVCELSEFRSERDTLSEPRFKYGTSERVESRAACSGEPFPECAQGELRTKGVVFYGAVSNACPKAIPVNLPTESSGALFKDRCRDLMGEFVERYRKRYGVPEGVRAGAYEVPRGGVISPNEPDSCIDYEPIGVEDGSKRRVCAEGVSYAVAEGCCKKFGWEGCVIEAVGAAGGDRGGLSGGGMEQVFDGARQRTVTTVQAAYPPARADIECGNGSQTGGSQQSDCLQVTAEATDNGRSAKMSAALRVPLRILNILGNLGGVEDKRGTVVEYSETRTLERALVGGVS